MAGSPNTSWWKRAWQRWLRIATVIGDFQARVILSVFYFVIVLPFGLLVRLFMDPLSIKGRHTTTWTPFAIRTRTIEEAGRQA